MATEEAGEAAGAEQEDELRVLEDQLRLKLYEVVDSITEMIKRSPSSSLLPYGDEVNAMFRHYAERGYRLGTDDATSVLRQEGYLTHADIDTIKQIATNHGQRFWARVQRGIIEKEMQMQNLRYTGEAPDSHLTREWIVDPVASSDVFTAYNEAVRTKAGRLT